MRERAHKDCLMSKAVQLEPGSIRGFPDSIFQMSAMKQVGPFAAWHWPSKQPSPPAGSPGQLRATSAAGSQKGLRQSGAGVKG